MIDHHCMNYKGSTLMLVKFPSCVLSQLLAASGGILKTVLTGKADSLTQLPTLVKFGTVKEVSGRTSSVFATEYKSGMLPYVTNLHYEILREVLSKPNLGITIHAKTCVDFLIGSNVRKNMIISGYSCGRIIT